MEVEISSDEKISFGWEDPLVRRGTDGDKIVAKGCSQNSVGVDGRPVRELVRIAGESPYDL